MRAYITLIYEEIILDAHRLFGDLFPRLKAKTDKIIKKRQDEYLADLKRKVMEIIDNSTFIDKQYREIWKGIQNGELLWVN